MLLMPFIVIYLKFCLGTLSADRFRQANRSSKEGYSKTTLAQDLNRESTQSTPSSRRAGFNSLLMKLAVKNPKQAIPIKWYEPSCSEVLIIHKCLQAGAAGSPRDKQPSQAEALPGLDPGGRPSSQPYWGSPCAKRHVDRNVREAKALDFFGLLVVFSATSQTHIDPVAAKCQKSMRRDCQKPPS
jgi:hypothetical protein